MNFPCIFWDEFSIYIYLDYLKFYFHNFCDFSIEQISLSSDDKIEKSRRLIFK